MKLSIITINYNNSSGLENTIKSVISQSYKDFEYIVIDGASTDDSRQIIESYNERLTYWVSELDSGIYNAMNKGIRKAKGEYLFFLNSGDSLYDADVLKNVFSKNLDCDIIYGNFNGISPAGSTNIVTLPNRITIPFLFSGTVCHQVSFIKRCLFERYGLYREDLKIVSDWSFFLKVFIFDRASQMHLPIVISNYYMDGLSSREQNQVFIAQEREKVLTEDFYKELLDTYDQLNKYRLFYNKKIFVQARKIKRKIKQFFGK